MGYRKRYVPVIRDFRIWFSHVVNGKMVDEDIILQAEDLEDAGKQLEGFYNSPNDKLEIGYIEEYFGEYDDDPF